MLSFSETKNNERAQKLSYIIAKTIGLPRLGFRHPGKAVWVVLLTVVLLLFYYYYYYIFYSKVFLEHYNTNIKKKKVVRHYLYNTNTLQKIGSPYAVNITVLVLWKNVRPLEGTADI